MLTYFSFVCKCLSAPALYLISCLFVEKCLYLNYNIVDARQISVTRNKSSRGNCIKCAKCCEKYIQSNTNHACVNTMILIITECDNIKALGGNSSALVGNMISAAVGNIFNPACDNVISTECDTIKASSGNISASGDNMISDAIGNLISAVYGNVTNNACGNVISTECNNIKASGGNISASGGNMISSVIGN